MNAKTIHVIIEGKVQGGNLHDGTVETTMSGPDDAITPMKKWLSKDSPHAGVHTVIIKDMEDILTFPDYAIRF